MPETTMQARKQTLTDADMEALTDLLKKQHSCRFDNITRDDMDFIKDLLGIYKETRSEVIKWIVKGIVYGSLLLIAIGAWVKYGGKQ
jgi:hypothetical protein